jgi:hypothetical protein
LITHNNSCLAFQEKAIANLQIQPRIQQVTTDGIGLEVGTGQILYDYNYITTSSGSTNMYSIDSTPSAVYYVDLLNKTFNRLSENGINGISDSLGLHTFFNNNLDVDTLKYSKYLQVINDNKTNDVYIINKDNFVLAFNELSNSFTSKYDFKSYLTGLYCEKGFYSSDNSNKLWKHNDNSYGSFYGDTYDSYITFLFSPNDMHREVIFNNLTLNTEYIDSEGNDVFYDEDYTVPFKSIFVWNDYMETNEEDLVYPNNIARKFRTWNIFIPRDKTNIFNRMRGKFVFVKLKIDNNLDNTLVLHDVVLSYVDNNK